MKKIYALLFALLMSVAVFGQNFVDEEFAAQKSDPENTVVFVSGKLFQMAAKVIPENEEIEEIGNVKELAGKVSSFNLLLDRSSEDPVGQYNAALGKLRNDFEELMTIRDQENNISFHIDEEDGIIYELVGIGTTDEKELVVFSLTGEIDLDQIGKILSKIDQERKSNIKTRERANIDNMKIYPNPASKGQVLNIEAPEELLGGKAMVYDLNGSLVHSYEIDKTIYQLNTNNYVPGKYIIRLQNGEISMQKKVLVVQ